MNLSAEPTPVMAAVGLDWLGVRDVIDHVLEQLEKHGPAALNVARGCLKLVAAVSGRDMVEVFRLANEIYVDVAALIAAIRAEFA